MSDHYKQLPSGILEPIEIWMRNGLNACAGNMLKYMVRFPYKGTPYQDWRKVKDYYEIWGKYEPHRIKPCSVEEINESVKDRRPCPAVDWCMESVEYYADFMARLIGIGEFIHLRYINLVFQDLVRSERSHEYLFNEVYGLVMRSDYMDYYKVELMNIQTKKFESNDGC